MFRKLRLKFIGIATLSTLVVLFIVLGSVNFITYRMAVSDIFTTLEFVANDPSNLPIEDVTIAIEKGDITPETQYEVRYIKALVDADGNLTNIDAEHIAAIEKPEMEHFQSEN